MAILTIRNSVLAVLSSLMVTASAVDADFNAVDGPNVRVVKHDDGGRTHFQRSPDHSTLTTKTFSPKGTLNLLTIYRMDKNTNPRSCKIYDGQKVELFKIRYGYRKSDLQLVEEQMFDSRVKRLDASGNERPVRRMIYTYDENGKRSAPIAISLNAGKTADQVFKPFVPEDNPFKKEELEKAAKEGKGASGR